jgi:hypothetical protein
LIQKEGVANFEPAYLFDEGSTISWVPCGRKLTCSFPGIKFAYGPDTYFDNEVIQSISICLYMYASHILFILLKEVLHMQELSRSQACVYALTRAAVVASVSIAVLTSVALSFAYERWMLYVHVRILSLSSLLLLFHYFRNRCQLLRWMASSITYKSSSMLRAT